MEPNIPEDGSSVAIPVFGVINLVFAGLSLFWILIFTLVMTYGVAASGDTHSEIVAGVVGSLICIVPAFAALIVYLFAGVGLIRRKSYGFYFHIAGAIMAALTCVGILYTVPAMLFAFQPQFKTPVLFH